ncbi:MAG: DUF692 domain-containing protein [Deltaproteobacteria bacterium]|nr:DUF692 domain-containing protein [Deltaproteobacteria bacterium]
MPAFPRLGYGVGLRTKHYSEILGIWPRVDWFEIISENFMVRGGRPLHVLEQVRNHYPIVLHGVSLSIGSADGLDFDYLGRLRALAERFDPAWVSDHLCWTGVGGHNLHDLLPLPYTEEAIDHVAERVKRVQDFLGRQILLENVSTYLEFQQSTMPEWEFLTAVVEQADCGILLDVNNIYVSAFNHGYDPQAYLNGVPAGRVHQFHLAGHTDRGTFLHDTHDHPVIPAVWDLYADAVRRFGSVSTLVEWDDHIPPFAEVLAEAEKARAVALASSTAADTRRPVRDDQSVMKHL